MEKELKVMKVFIATRGQQSSVIVNVEGFKPTMTIIEAPEVFKDNTMLSALSALNQTLDLIKANTGKYIYEIHTVDVLAKNIKAQTFKYAMATGVKASTGEVVSEEEKAEWNKFMENNTVFTIFRSLNDLSFAYKERKYKNAMLTSKEKIEKNLVSQCWENLAPVEEDTQDSEAIPY